MECAMETDQTAQYKSSLLFYLLDGKVRPNSELLACDGNVEFDVVKECVGRRLILLDGLYTLPSSNNFMARAAALASHYMPLDNGVHAAQDAISFLVTFACLSAKSDYKWFALVESRLLAVRLRKMEAAGAELIKAADCGSLEAMAQWYTKRLRSNFYWDLDEWRVPRLQVEQRREILGGVIIPVPTDSTWLGSARITGVDVPPCMKAMMAKLVKANQPDDVDEYARRYVFDYLMSIGMQEREAREKTKCATTYKFTGTSPTCAALAHAEICPFATDIEDLMYTGEAPRAHGLSNGARRSCTMKVRQTHHLPILYSTHFDSPTTLVKLVCTAHRVVVTPTIVDMKD